MKKQNVVDALAEKTGQPKAKITAVLAAIDELLIENSKAGKNTPIGHMTATVKAQSERSGRNPATGESITVPAKNVIKVRVTPTLKNAIN